MNLRNKRFVSVLLSLFVCGGTAIYGTPLVSAGEPSNNTATQKNSNDQNENIYNLDVYGIYVSDVFELLQAVDRVYKWGKIILTNDIDMLSLKLNLHNSIVLDLNGHTITVGNESDGIVVENKVTINQKKIVKKYPSSYVWDEKNNKVKKPFFGGDGYQLEVVDYEVSEQYDDDICVTIMNGKIAHKKGENGNDGIPNTWFKCSGVHGETPNAPLVVNSGNVYLSNLEIIGGDGGNGGKGAYYAGAHFPINGGCGADGGDAGDGGSAISVSRKEVKLMITDDCKISSGKPGKAGKGGESNENYWVYRSKNGVDGSEGVSKPEITYKYKK